MKTIEQLVDENPDATPEQITELMTQQPYVASMAPAPKGPASMLPDRVNLNGGEKPGSFYGLGLTQTRDTNKEMNLGVGQPDVPEMPAPQEEKPKETAMKVDVAAIPPRVSEQARVAKLYSDRNNLEENLQKDIEREEDTIRETKGSVGTEAALAAGGKVLAGTIGKMLNYDASPQVEGFKSAEKSIASKTDENRQRREFLKERLYRADNPTKRTLDDLKIRGAVRSESLAAETEPLVSEKARTDLQADVQDNENRFTKGQEIGARYNTNSADYRLNKIKQEAQLTGLANKPGPNQEIAKKLLENKDQYLDQIGPDNYDAMTKDLFKAEKDKQPFQFKDYSVGDNTGYGTFNEETGEFKKLDEGYKTPSSSGSGDDKLEQKTMQLSDRIIKNKINNIDDSMQGIDRIAAKYGGIEKVPGTEGVMRILPNWAADTIAPEDLKALRQYVQKASNAIMQSESGTAVSGTEEIRQLTALGQGKFGSAQQLKQGIEMIKSINERVRQSVAGGFNKKTQAAYIEQGGKGLNPKDANAKIISDPNDL